MINREKNKKRLFLSTLLIVFGIIFLFQTIYYHYLESPVDANSTENISFLIKKGETASTVGENLEEKGIIKSSTTFGIYSRTQKLAEKIISGRFMLQKSMTIKQILQIVTDPSKAESIIVIQEGLTVKEIDERLVEMELIKDGEFISAVKAFESYEAYPFLDKEKLQKLGIPLEGYLFPDTYFLDGADFKPEQLIIKCLNNFNKKLPEKPENLHEIITMASIVELEVRTEKDLPIVAGILWKRYKQNWHLGADATLLYITDDRKISEEDLKIDSPYNTRKVTGMPPGPIGNPGIKSIEASIHPKESKYWYYLTALDSGEVIYAETNEEQNENRAEYLY